VDRTGIAGDGASMTTESEISPMTRDVPHRIDADAASALAAESAQCLERGDTAAGRALIDRALALAPDRVDLLRLSAIASIKENRPAEAIALLLRAIAREPGNASLYNNLGSAYRTIGDDPKAIGAFEHACALAPAFAAAWFNLGKLLKLSSRSCEADRALRQASALRPDHVPTWIVHAENLKALGRIDDAAAAYRRALDCDAAAPHAWWGLANLKTVAFSAANAAALAACANGAPNDASRALLHFALAKALEDNHRDDEAIVALDHANALIRRERPWDADRFSADVDATMAAFRIPPPSRHVDCAVVFIVSLPRSGSTLTEQILASHSEVEGGGELSTLERVIREESQRRGMPFPEWASAMMSADWHRLGETYLARTSHLRATKRVSTDKALPNWLYLGAAAAMLPGARFVHCVRDPLETGISCYRQWFSQGQDFSFDLDDIARYTVDHHRLMRHWTNLFGTRIHRHALEDLQEDTDEAICRMLAFAGLAFEEPCLRSHRTERSVRTASAAQVRLPIARNTTRASSYPVPTERLMRAMKAGEEKVRSRCSDVHDGSTSRLSP
jgi:tetratricopeptide (TPR) repeat protein